MDAYLEEDEECPQRRAPEDIPSFPFPIESVDIAIARLQVADRIGRVPFDEYEECSRSLWVVFAGYDIAIAAVVLRRPAPDWPSRADRQVFRLMHKAAATRDTVPWSFFVTGPEGSHLMLTKAERERYRC